MTSAYTASRSLDFDLSQRKAAVIITDRAMQAKPSATDQWMTQPFKRGAGVFVARITPAGERLFYFRSTDSAGRRPFMPIGGYHPKGSNGQITLKEAYRKACELSTLYQSGVIDLREHFDAEAATQLAEKENAEALHKAAKALALQEASQRLTVSALFEHWAEVDLAPRKRADGKRAGRKDGGEYTRAQFERRVFGPIGAMEARLVRKSDVMSILDGVKAEGKLRTANMLLADLKQMFQFALEREMIQTNPLAAISKRAVGGSTVKRDRVLSADEVKSLAVAIPRAGLKPRSALAIWIVLATACRVGELMSSKWSDVRIAESLWFLPETKNQRSHSIHLSTFAKSLFQALMAIRDTELKLGEEKSEWVFPSYRTGTSVDIKSFGKQLSDRQRIVEKKLKNRASRTDVLLLSGGHWTSHDLRRTAASTMARLGVSDDVINECLNHVNPNSISRVYIHDRRLEQQASAFEMLGTWLHAHAPDAANAQ